MESHLPRTHGHHYEQDPLNPAGSHPSGVEGEDDNRLVKKSVLTKVKTKAKKIKNTLTKHGHGHDHHHDHEHKHVEEDEDEQMVEDPEIHGAPIYESVAVMSGVLGTEGIVGQPGFNLERPSVMAEDRHDSKMTEPPVRPLGQWQEGELGQPEGNLGRLMPKEESHDLPEFSDNYGTGIRSPSGKNLYGGDESLGRESYTEILKGMGGIGGPTRKNIVGQEEHLGGEGGLIGMSTGMEEDPHGPNCRGVSSNVQAKTIDPTGRGSEEAEGITPTLRSFEKMGIYDNPDSKPKAEPLCYENPDSYPKSYDASRPQDLTSDTFSGNPSYQSTTYTEKIPSAASAETSVVADTSKSSKNVVASKLGYGENEKKGSHEEKREQEDTTNSASVIPLCRESPESIPKSYDASRPLTGIQSNQSTTYTENITSATSAATSAIADAAKSAKKVVASKLGYGGNGNTGARDEMCLKEDTDESPSAESISKSYDARSPLTGNQSNQSSTYTQKFTSATSAATSAIADTAKTAKNVVASKLGYGGNETTTPHEEMHTPEDTTKAPSATQTATDYAQKIAGTVTDTLSPVCGKVAGAGSDVMSKMQGSGTGQERSESEVQDRGISVTSYWTEKLKPGEEDKLLSEVITGTFIKPKAEIEKKIEQDVPSGGGQGVSRMISDAVQKREPAMSGEREPTGILEESKESESGGAGNVGGGTVGVLDKIKGVVGSWVGGKGGETTETSPGTTDASGNEEIMVKDGRVVAKEWKS